MKHLLLLAALFIGAIAAQAQDFEYTVEYNLGYGDYRMSAMKDNLKSNLTSINGYRTTDDFSGDMTHDIRAGVIFMEQHQAGLLFGYLNTAGQNHLGDYSGDIRYKIRNRGYKLGTFYRYFLVENSPFQPFLEGSMGTILNRSKSSYHLRVGDESISETTRMKGHNIFIQPAVGVLFKFHRHIGVQATVGYELDIIKKMHLKGDRDTKMTRADWSGLRISIGAVAFL
ncbi:MAG: hypothetical protein LUH22_19770 [Bacteroides sp.]|nr:hypothetical protein [Bacteroides sp.]